MLSLVFTGSAMATTAIGTLIPMLRDAGELHTPFGTLLLAAGAVGEFGPILLVTLVLSTTQPAPRTPRSSCSSSRSRWSPRCSRSASVSRGYDVLERTLESSGQLAVRLSVVMVFALVALAAELGLDLLLGGFVAGHHHPRGAQRREVERFESKLVAVGYGFFIPFFFIVSGVKFDLDALLAAPRPSQAAALPRPDAGRPRHSRRSCSTAACWRAATALALAFFSATELPLVVAITTLAVDGGHMRTITAASLVGAAILSTLIFPLVGLRLRGVRDPALVTATP